MELWIEDGETLWQGLQVNIPKLGYIEFEISWLIENFCVL